MSLTTGKGFCPSLLCRALRYKNELKSILKDDKCRDGPKGPFVRSMLIQALQVQAHVRNGLSEEAIIEAVIAAGDNSPPLRAALHAIRATCLHDTIRSIIKEPSMAAFFNACVLSAG